MPSKLDRSRFSAARAELKADLEVVHLLLATNAELVPNLETLRRIALAALAQSAEGYADAGRVMGLGRSPQSASDPTTSGPMSTEDLIRLVATDAPEGEPEDG